MQQSISTNYRADFDFDVIIAGGGPAGSTAATLLAQYGHDVLLLEKDSHPRFHIGESMLPRSEPVMQRLGIDWGEGNLPKSGAEFIDEDQHKQIYFPLGGDNRTFQIERSRFDHLLFDNASKYGATTHQQECVSEVDTTCNCVTVTTTETRYLCRYFIDASGRSAIMGRRRQSIRQLRNLGRFALYSHYRNVVAGSVHEIFQSGNVKVLSVDIGWIWVIPMIGNRLSIGLVVQRKPADGVANKALLNNYIQRSALLSGMLAGAEMEFAVRGEADFSFVNENRYGVRYACCGDSAGFIDPVFSSGVFLAVTSAARIADRLHQALVDHREADANLHLEDDKEYELGFRTMHLIVERFYQSDLVHNLFFEAERDAKIKREIGAILAGDLWSGSNQFQNVLLKGRRGNGAVGMRR